MMPILHSPGVITPGQLGPINRLFEAFTTGMTNLVNIVGPEIQTFFSSLTDRVTDFIDKVMAEGARQIDKLLGMCPNAAVNRNDPIPGPA